MKKILITFLLITTAQIVQAQSFEGVIIYSLSYEVKGKFSSMKDVLMEKLKEKEDYFDTLKVYIKQGNYKKVNNAASATSIIYRSDENKIYNLIENFEYVTIADASKVSISKIEFPEPEIFNSDTLKTINGIPCKAMVVRWSGLGDEWYFYNENTAVVNADLFRQHQLEYLDVILKATGSYPLEISKSINNFITVNMRLVSIEETAVADSEFDIPALKKADKKTVKAMGLLFDQEVMKIKN